VIKVGVFFGGFSHEREVSFNGGRNVCQYIDRSIFEPVPVFVDSFGNFVELNWELFKKNSIRDFYPQASTDSSKYQIYAESLGKLSADQQNHLIASIGKKINAQDLAQRIDFALIAMHGTYGEDGNLQGLLEWYGIPYSGSGVFGAALGIDKALQNGLIANVSGQDKKFISFGKQEFLDNPEALFQKLQQNLGLPLVIKAPHQGSSIGVGILKENELEKFIELVYNSLFIRRIAQNFWKNLSADQKQNYLQDLLELDKGLGMPVIFNEQLVFHPEDLAQKLDEFLAQNTQAILTAVDGEEVILVEEFIKGREFTCAVIQKEDASAMALLPSEAQKATDALFDFNSKYKGLVKEVIVMEASQEAIQKIRSEAENIFEKLGFQVYIRMDGFLSENNKICFHDPNTIPGMSSASFIFKQFAELGFLPTHTINYLIRTSLAQRLSGGKNRFKVGKLLKELDEKLAQKTYKDRFDLVFSDEKSYAEAKENMKTLASKGTHQVRFLAKYQDGYKVFPTNLMFRDSFEEALAEWELDLSSYTIDLIGQSADLIGKYVKYESLKKEVIGAEKVEKDAFLV